MTTDGVGLAHLGFGTLAAASGPDAPGGGGPSMDSLGDVAGTTDSGGDVDPSSAGGDDAGGVAGDTGSGGGGSGSGSGGGGAGAGKLPFTGFAAATVGAIGAGLTAAGATARRRLSRR